MPPIKLLIAELEAALKPTTLGRVVLGWPRVSHPAVVRAWLGDEAVDIDYELSDPEACGWALFAARVLFAGGDATAMLSQHPRWTDDEDCRRYAEGIIERWKASLN